MGFKPGLVIQVGSRHVLLLNAYPTMEMLTPKSRADQQAQHHSRNPSQAPEPHAPRDIAPHPQSYSDYQGHPDYGLQMQHHGFQQMQQHDPQHMQASSTDASATPVMKREKARRACDQCRLKKVSLLACSMFFKPVSPLLYVRRDLYPIHWPFS